MWIAAYHRYVFAFELYSAKASAEKSKEEHAMIPEKDWLEAFRATQPTKTPLKRPPGGRRLAGMQALVYRFAKDLPRGYSWTLYLDNPYINQPLLSLLRKDLAVGAMGTTRKNALRIPSVGVHPLCLVTAYKSAAAPYLCATSFFTLRPSTK